MSISSSQLLSCKQNYICGQKHRLMKDKQEDRREKEKLIHIFRYYFNSFELHYLFFQFKCVIEKLLFLFLNLKCFFKLLFDVLYHNSL